MTRIKIALSLCFILLMAGVVSAQQKPLPPTTSVKPPPEAKATTPERSFWQRLFGSKEVQFGADKCDLEYYKYLTPEDTTSRCDYYFKSIQAGTTIPNLKESYTCQFKENYPEDPCPEETKIDYMGLEAYSCKANRDITAISCHEGYDTKITFNRVEDDPEKIYQYGFFCIRTPSTEENRELLKTCKDKEFDEAKGDRMIRIGRDHCCLRALVHLPIELMRKDILLREIPTR